jgi:hypothetical protein
VCVGFVGRDGSARGAGCGSRRGRRNGLQRNSHPAYHHADHACHDAYHARNYTDHARNYTDHAYYTDNDDAVADERYVSVGRKQLTDEHDPGQRSQPEHRDGKHADVHWV